MTPTTRDLALRVDCWLASALVGGEFWRRDVQAARTELANLLDRLTAALAAEPEETGSRITHTASESVPGAYTWSEEPAEPEPCVASTQVPFVSLASTTPRDGVLNSVLEGIAQAARSEGVELTDADLADEAGPPPPTPERERLAAMCEAAGHDERLSTGQLYLDAARLLRAPVACAKCAEWEQSFALYDAAQRRGIALWQAAHPDEAQTWPDAGHLVAWLLEQRAPVDRERLAEPTALERVTQRLTRMADILNSEGEYGCEAGDVSDLRTAAALTGWASNLLVADREPSDEAEAERDAAMGASPEPSEDRTQWHTGYDAGFTAGRVEGKVENPSDEEVARELAALRLPGTPLWAKPNGEEMDSWCIRVVRAVNAARERTRGGKE